MKGLVQFDNNHNITANDCNVVLIECNDANCDYNCSV